MEIDPAALSRINSNPNGPASAGPSGAPFSGKALTNSASKNGSKPSQQAVARVDLEFLYSSLKSVIADNWGTYKDAISRFVLGYLSQEELARLLDLIILSEPSTVHLHNQLMCALYANILRDAPESAVASWVSANDKPTSVSKPPTGDAAEQRLKSEVMHLPHRMRHRLKSIQDEPQQPLIHSLLSTTYARSLVGSGGASSSSASGGLSKDLEIRRRYTLALASEAEDIPTRSTLSDRILPICYEEGLQSGLSNPESCSEILSTALDTFLKETITDIVSRTRCNPPLSTPKPDATLIGTTNPQTQSQKDGIITYTTEAPSLGITTHAYRQKVAKEEEAFANGELKRSEAGLLPSEQAAAARTGSGKMAPGDFNIAWETGGLWLKGIAPWLGESIAMERGYREDGGADENDDGRTGEHRPGVDAAGDADDHPLTNGVAGVNGHAEHDNDEDNAMVIDEPEWQWHGASKADRSTLNSLLDECLSFQ